MHCLVIAPAKSRWCRELIIAEKRAQAYSPCGFCIHLLPTHKRAEAGLEIRAYFSNRSLRGFSTPSALTLERAVCEVKN